MKLNGTTLSHQFIDVEYPTERDAVRMLMDWFHFHPGHVGIFYNPLITEHYWMVFRDLTEDENEDDYGTHHVPSIESRWEIASGWFTWQETHESHDDLARKVFCRTLEMDNIYHLAEYL